MISCKNPHCNKPAISFSHFCGAHTDNEAYALMLNALPSVKGATYMFDELTYYDGNYPQLFISEVELEGVHLKDMKWYDCTIEDCVFSECSFENMVFEECTLRDAVFNKTTFVSGGFLKDSIIASASFDDCLFQAYSFYRIALSNVFFQDGTKWKDGDWQHLQLANVDFLKAEIEGLDMKYCVIDHCSFQDADIRRLTADEVKFKVSFAHNARFSDCHLTHYESDLLDMELPVSICTFSDCSIDKSLRIEGFGSWNGVEEDAYALYDRLLDRIEDVVHVDNLQPIQDIVERLYDGVHMDYDLARRLQRIFVKYFDQIKKTGDLSGLGTIVNLISRLPQELILDKSQYLPAPSTLADKNILRIEIKKDVTNLAEMNDVMTRLHALDVAIQDAGHGKIVLEDFRKGSVTIVISSTVAAIVLIVWLLYKAGHLFLNTQNLFLTNQQLKREKKNAKANNKKLEQEVELNAQQKKLNEQQMVLNDLEIEKRKQELRAQNLPDQYISVTREEVSELTHEDPFDRLELKQLNDLQKVADDVLDLGETNVYVEILARELGEE